jgi:hypothetical protein
LGRSRDEIIGSHQTTLHPPDLADHFAELFIEYTGHPGFDLDAEVVTKSGDRIPVLITTTTTFIGGSPIMQGIFRNNLERKQAEEELRQYFVRLEALVKERTSELEKKNAELERLNRLFVGRELRMIELKKRIEQLEGGPDEHKT